MNVDYFTQVRSLPKSGETVAALDYGVRFGGKGANQALAAARQGAAVSLIGSLGEDEMGATYRKRLSAEGIDLRGVVSCDHPTGSAFISVDRKGENTIVVASGANGRLTEAMIEAQRESISTAAMLLLQFETPFAAIRQALEIAVKAEVPIMVNPSPLIPGFPWDEFPIDYLIVNETEAAEIDRLLAAEHELHVNHLIITRGSSSTLVIGESGEFEVPTFALTPKDTVGAGDAFAGTLAARLVQGESLKTATQHANVAGALTTLSVGAQEAIPSKTRVDTETEQKFKE